MSAMLAEEQRDRARHSMLSAIKDVRVLTLTAIQFGYTLGSSGIGIWLPQILKTHGLSNLSVGFVSGNTVVLVCCMCVAMLVWGCPCRDRTGRKILNLTLGFLLAAVGLVLSVGWTDMAPALIGFSDSGAGRCDLSARAIFWTSADQLPGPGRGAARRPRLHHDDRLARRFLRPLHDRLDQGFDGLVCLGITRHGRNPCSNHSIVGGLAIGRPPGVGAADHKWSPCSGSLTQQQLSGPRRGCTVSFGPVQRHHP